MSSGLLAQGIGASARAASPVYGAWTAGGVLGVARGMGGTTSYRLTTANAGATLGIGAPWSGFPLGAWLEAGVLFGSVDGTNPEQAAQRFVDPYAALGALATLAASSLFRPWVGVSLVSLARPVRISERGSEVTSLPVAIATVDAGIAWAAW